MKKSAKNIMGNLKLSNKPSRNGFDIGRRVISSCKLGQLLPYYVADCLPNDSFRIKLHHNGRTAPVQETAFVRLKTCYNWFFVPYRLLWRDFPSFVTNMGLAAKSATSIASPRTIGEETPVISRSQLIPLLHAWSNSGDGFGYNVSVVNTNRGSDLKRLLQHLGYYNVAAKDATDSSYNVRLSPFPLLAYQKIYNDWFRNMQWERESPESYNIDYLASGQSVPISQLWSQGDKAQAIQNKQTMFDLRYVDLPKDLFFGVKPSQQYGAVAKVTNVVDSSQVTLNANGAYTLDDSPTTINSSGTLEYLTTQASKTSTEFKINNLASTFDILSLRYAQALQEWKEITLNNKTDYASQIEAHFGVKVNHALGNVCDYIGGDSFGISLSTTNNTNLADENSWLSQRSIGYASGDDSVEFTAKEHGILMCVGYSTLTPEYDSVGYDPICLRTEFTDYAQPEFDKLGFEAVPRIYLNGNGNEYVANQFLGYQSRYYDYKSNYDVVLDSFSSVVGGTLQNYTLHINQWNSKFLSEDYLTLLNYGDFKVRPSYVDPIFYAASDDSLDTDQFWNVDDFTVFVTRSLSRLGLPY